MSNKGYGEEAKDWFNKVRSGIVKWLDDHDSQTWPAFLLFFIVVTAGMIFNVDAFSPVVGFIPSVAIGGFFEYAILAWKLTTNRTRNDAKQSQIAYAALWLSVVLALAMLVVNMFRIGGEQGFEIIAYTIVGITAGVQLVGFLLYDGADPDKAMNRDHSQNQRGSLRKRREADQKISELEDDARILEMVGDKVSEVRRKYAHLPPELLEPLLKKTTDTLLAGYEVSPNVQNQAAQMADVNKDGKIGGMGGRKAMDRGMTSVLRNAELISEDQIYESNKVGLEAIKELPIETLFEDEEAQEGATPEPEDKEPDF